MCYRQQKKCFLLDELCFSIIFPKFTKFSLIADISIRLTSKFPQIILNTKTRIYVEILSFIYWTLLTCFGCFSLWECYSYEMRRLFDLIREMLVILSLLATCQMVCILHDSMIQCSILVMEPKCTAHILSRMGKVVCYG